MKVVPRGAATTPALKEHLSAATSVHLFELCQCRTGYAILEVTMVIIDVSPSKDGV